MQETPVTAPTSSPNLAALFTSAVFTSLPAGFACINIEIWEYQYPLFDAVFTVESENRDPTLLRLTFSITVLGTAWISLLEIDNGGEAIDGRPPIVHSLADVDAALKRLPALFADVIGSDEPEDDDEDDEPEDDDEDDDEDDEPEDDIMFANPGSALRTASRHNSRNLPCPTCDEPDRLTPGDNALGYQCDACANRAEGRGDYE